jgi:hypothetical protein
VSAQNIYPIITESYIDVDTTLTFANSRIQGNTNIILVFTWRIFSIYVPAPSSETIFESIGGLLGGGPHLFAISCVVKDLSGNT